MKLSGEMSISLRPLPHNRGSAHHIAKAQPRSLHYLGLSGGVLPKPRGQRLTQFDLNYGQADDGQTEHNGPDSDDVTSNGVCFHGFTLADEAPRVLIDKSRPAIDWSDERQQGATTPMP